MVAAVRSSVGAGGDRVGQSQHRLQRRAWFEDDRPDEAGPSWCPLHDMVLGQATKPRYRYLDSSEGLTSTVIPAVVPLPTGQQAKHGDLAGSAHADGARCGPTDTGDHRAPGDQRVIGVNAAHSRSGATGRSTVLTDRNGAVSRKSSPASRSRRQRTRIPVTILCSCLHVPNSPRGPRSPASG